VIQAGCSLSTHLQLPLAKRWAHPDWCGRARQSVRFFAASAARKLAERPGEPPI